MLPSPLVRASSSPTAGGRLLSRSSSRRRTGAILVKTVSTTRPVVPGSPVHSYLHAYVLPPVPGLIYTSARPYSGITAEAATMGRGAIIAPISSESNTNNTSKIGGPRVRKRRSVEAIHTNSCLHTPREEFGMHEYLRRLVALYRKCATSQERSRGRGDAADGLCIGTEPERQRISRSESPLARVPGRNARHPPPPPPPPPPHLSSRSGQDVAAPLRRSYSTSAAIFAPSSAPASSSSSSFPTSPYHTTTNDKTSREPDAAPRNSTHIDFDRLSAAIPDQSVTGVDSLWYVVATASLLAFHKEAAVGELWKYISQRCADEGQVDGIDAQDRQLRIARRIRESCLKASVLVGFPRCINALLALQSSLSTSPATEPAVLSTLHSDKPLRTLSTFPSAEARYTRGKRFFTQIYSKHAERVLASMSASSAGDLSYFAVSSIYGELMAETRILDGRETVLLEFVCCLADGVGAQAKGHFFGCRNLGVTGAEMRGAVELVRRLAGQLGLVSFLERVREGEFRFLEKAGSW
ncbi:predicted protein [Histoplasma mississippiense (nom. inval.)]|uniref:predicted protein n=1 Tax=Ajellomyces capsulatus (strain NAm1 / WU24) TaxID=2059318 RepID=UPI000157CB67|nr:predicted protein [Histoplasma mississippiense (nom. inval.)]EDN10727.1 predicted protein [Histoplasma mississippiense (nom. inval.)]